MNYKVLQPQELKNYWPEIKYGLEQVLRKTPSAKWIPEDVYADITYKRVVCVMGLKNDDLEWFFIGHPHDNGIFIWAAYCEGDLSKGMQALVDYAKAINCSHVTFKTDRKGWNKVAKKYGFHPTAWKMEI